MKKMKPILFNLAMTRAILAGRKTVTRRVAFKRQDLREFHSREYPEGWWFNGRVYKDWNTALVSPQGLLFHCKYRPGDILYIREAFGYASDILDGEPGPVYQSDYTATEQAHLKKKGWKWKPSLHMPKDLARIFLKITSIRLEPLHDIFLDPPGPDNQVAREGCLYSPDFIAVWDSTVPKKDRDTYGFEANPWVWVLEFEQISKEEALKEAEL